MSEIVIGAGEQGEVTLDLNVLADTRLLIQGTSRSGKSGTLRRILEQSHGMLQHIVIDPEGEFATLREKFDYIVGAAEGGDFSPRAYLQGGERERRIRVEKLVTKILELRVSTVIDLYELKAHEQRDFVRLFSEALVEAPRRLRHPLLYAVDEVQLFIPEGEKAESATAVIDVAKRGGKRGIVTVYVTHRISGIRKDAVAMMINNMIGLTTLDIDMSRAGRQLGFAKPDWDRLSQLKKRQFFATGPAFNVGRVGMVYVADVETTMPKVGQGQLVAPPAPSAKVREVLAKLADLPAEAEQEAKSIEDLKRDNANLRREITIAKKEQRVEQVACGHEGEIARLEEVIDAKERELAVYAKLASEVTAAVGDFAEANEHRYLTELVKPTAPARRTERVRPAEQTQRTEPTQRTTQTRHAPPPPAEGLTGPEQRILNAIAWWEAMGVKTPSKQNVGFVAGYRVGKKVGGHYGNTLGALRANGLIDYPTPNVVELTIAGRKVAEAPDDMRTLADLQAAIFERLDGPERKVLQAIADAWPDALTKQEAGARAGYQVGEKVGGHYGNVLGALRTLGLVEYPKPGKVAATELLFPEGLR